MVTYSMNRDTKGLLMIENVTHRPCKLLSIENGNLVKYWKKHDISLLITCRGTAQYAFKIDDNKGRKK